MGNTEVIALCGTEIISAQFEEVERKRILSTNQNICCVIIH